MAGAIARRQNVPPSPARCYVPGCWMAGNEHSVREACDVVRGVGGGWPRGVAAWWPGMSIYSDDRSTGGGADGTGDAGWVGGRAGPSQRDDEGDGAARWIAETLARAPVPSAETMSVIVSVLAADDVV
jgi:hypothetical protein